MVRYNVSTPPIAVIVRAEFLPVKLPSELSIVTTSPTTYPFHLFVIVVPEIAPDVVVISSLNPEPLPTTVVVGTSNWLV